MKRLSDFNAFDALVEHSGNNFQPIPSASTLATLATLAASDINKKILLDENEWAEFYQERAAILQYEAKYSKEEAEYWAKCETFKRYVRLHHPVDYDLLEAILAKE